MLPVLGQKALCPETTLLNCGRLLPFMSLPGEVRKCICYTSSTVWVVKEATANGCTYANGAAIVVDFTSDGDPVFICITHIFIPHEGYIDNVWKALASCCF